jgi:hypothetical protein
MERLRTFGLCLDITLTGTKSESVFQQLFSHVVAQTNESNIQWSPRPGTASPDNTSNDYVESPFIILVNGKVSKDKGHHPLHPLHCSTYDITLPKLIKTLKKITHPLQPSRNVIAICMYLTLPWHNVVCLPLIQGPRWGKIRILDVEGQVLHSCAARRIMNGFHSAEYGEAEPTVGCFSDCLNPNVGSLAYWFGSVKFII